MQAFRVSSAWIDLQFEQCQSLQHGNILLARFGGARIASANMVTYALTGSGKLAVKLVEAYLELYETDHDEHWRQLVGRCLVALHDHRNETGWYAQDWQADPLPADKPARLIDQSATARAYWLAAEHQVELSR